jgi:hypothetical protein
MAWQRFWENRDANLVAEIQTGKYGGTIRVGEPYSDPPPAETPDDTLANVTFWTLADLTSLQHAAMRAERGVGE